jgi:LacI family transcriptional regulator, galactose operon repressor
LSVTIIDIAHETGYSKSTVHRVLSGAERVNYKTREAILAVAKRHNYRANLQARALKGAKTNLIGALVPDLSNVHYAKLIYGAEQLIEEYGCSLIILTSHRDMLKQERLLSQIRQHAIDGFIFSPVEDRIETRLIKTLSSAGVPFVGIHNTLNPHISAVQSGEVEGAYMAVKHLIKLGHRRIAHLTIDQPLDPGIELKLNGYRKALADYNIAFDPDLIVQDSKLYNYDAGYSGFKKLIADGTDATAIFVLCDRIAVGVYRAAAELGIRIPDDISVVSYDNREFTEVMLPRLTSVEADFEKIGRAACKILMARIKNPNRANERLTIKPRLKIKDSCKSIKIEG